MPELGDNGPLLLHASPCAATRAGERHRPRVLARGPQHEMPVRQNSLCASMRRYGAEDAKALGPRTGSNAARRRGHGQGLGWQQDGRRSSDALSAPRSKQPPHENDITETVAPSSRVEADITCSITCCSLRADDLIIFNLFRYITFRSWQSAFTASPIQLRRAPTFIRWMQAQAGQGPADPQRRHRAPPSKKGTPTMGGVMILAGIVSHPAVGAT